MMKKTVTIEAPQVFELWFFTGYDAVMASTPAALDALGRGFEVFAHCDQLRRRGDPVRCPGCAREFEDDPPALIMLLQPFAHIGPGAGSLICGECATLSRPELVDAIVDRLRALGAHDAQVIGVGAA